MNDREKQLYININKMKYLKLILSDHEVYITEEKSRMSNSRYLYAIFPKNKIYKFRFSDHEIPTIDENGELRKTEGEKIDGFFDCGDMEYKEIGNIATNLIIKHGAKVRPRKPKWVSKIKKICEDYFNSQEYMNNKGSLIDVTAIFHNIKNRNQLQLKDLYKYNSIKEAFKEAEVEIPNFVNKILDKYEVLKMNNEESGKRIKKLKWEVDLTNETIKSELIHYKIIKKKEYTDIEASWISPNMPVEKTIINKIQSQAVEEYKKEVSKRKENECSEKKQKRQMKI